MQLTSKEKSWTLRQKGDPRHMRMVVWVDRGSLSVVALRRRKAEQSPGQGATELLPSQDPLAILGP